MPLLNRTSALPTRAESMQRAGIEALLSAGREGEDVYTPSPAAAGLATSNPAQPNAARVPQHGTALCGAPACAGGWIAPWKRRRHIAFEGRSACSSRCLRAMVHAAILREGSDTRSSHIGTPHRHRIPLGLVMLAQGWITHPQLQRALDVQRASGSGRIGDWLISECGLQPAAVTRGLSVQWSCPVLSTDGFSPQAMACVLPRLFVDEYGVLPLRIAGSKILYLGFQDHLDASAGFAAERMSGLRVESGMVEQHDFHACRQRLLTADFPAATFENLADRDSLAAAIVRLLESEQPASARLIRLHRHYWLRTHRRESLPGATRIPTNIPANIDDAIDDLQDHLFTIGPEA